MAVLMSLCLAFVAESPMARLGPKTEDEMRKTWDSIANMVVNGIVVVAYRDDGQPAGAIGGYICPFWWDADKLMGLELFWYVTPESRGSKAALKTLMLFESECKAAGAQFTMMQAGLTEGAQANSFLIRKGYQVQGPMCLKEL